MENHSRGIVVSNDVQRKRLQRAARLNHSGYFETEAA